MCSLARVDRPAGLTHPEKQYSWAAADGGRRTVVGTPITPAGSILWAIVSRLLDDICDTEDARVSPACAAPFPCASLHVSFSRAANGVRASLRVPLRRSRSASSIFCGFLACRAVSAAGRNGLIVRRKLRGSDFGVRWVSGTCFHPPSPFPGSFRASGSARRVPRKGGCHKGLEFRRHGGRKRLSDGASQCISKTSLRFWERGSRGGWEEPAQEQTSARICCRCCWPRAVLTGGDLKIP